MGCLLALIILYFLGEYQGVWEADGVGWIFAAHGCAPGARFDPVGPGPFPGGIGGIGGRGRGSGGPLWRKYEGPDNDEFMPPGMVSMMFFSCHISSDG